MALSLVRNYDYEIALERLFTEALQGKSVDDFAKKAVFDFSEKNTNKGANILNAFKAGLASFPLSLFEESESSQFSPPDFIDSNATNKEILAKIIANLQNDSYDIYVRDVSSLGFPSYQIIIPSLSEIQSMTKMSYQSLITICYVREMITNPKIINKDNVTHLILLIYITSGSLGDDTISCFSGVNTKYDYPGKDAGLDSIYLLSMCYVFLEDYKKALQVMLSFHSNMKNKNPDKLVWYVCVLRYLEGMVKFSDHNKVCRYLNKIFKKEMCDKIDQIFINPAEVFVKQYPKIDLTCNDSENEQYYKDFYLYKSALNKLRLIQENSLINQCNCKNIISTTETVC